MATGVVPQVVHGVSGGKAERSGHRADVYGQRLRAREFGVSVSGNSGWPYDTSKQQHVDVANAASRQPATDPPT